MSSAQIGRGKRNTMYLRLLCESRVAPAAAKITAVHVAVNYRAIAVRVLLIFLFLCSCAR